MSNVQILHLLTGVARDCVLGVLKNPKCCTIALHFFLITIFNKGIHHGQIHYARKFSLNGVKGVIKSSADRASEAKKAVEAAGGKFISYDFTRGTYDFVGIADGLNDATASALKGVVLSSGDFEQIDMLNTYDQSEFSKTAKSIMSAGYKPPSKS